MRVFYVACPLRPGPELTGSAHFLRDTSKWQSRIRISDPPAEPFDTVRVPRVIF